MWLEVFQNYFAYELALIAYYNAAGPKFIHSVLCLSDVLSFSCLCLIHAETLYKSLLQSGQAFIPPKLL